MNRPWSNFLFFVFGLLSIANLAGAEVSTDVFAPPKADEVRNRVSEWLDGQSVTDAQREQINSVWTNLDESMSADRLLDRVVQSFAIIDTDAMKLIHECNSAHSNELISSSVFLKQSKRGPFFTANLNLFYGRCLVERRFLDEGWEVLKGIDPRQVVDPASLFFFQAVSAQGMLELKPALEAIDQLLTNTERVPVRYSATASLMKADLKGLQEKSLGEIAKLMSDSERRLELGRAGEKVQEVQERIIANLDEIIKKTEQQGGGGGGGDGSSKENAPAGGADDSRVKGSEAPMEVDKKRFEDKGSWGNLPPKDLAKAKNDLNKNFPSNYEQAIEKYTKKLAGRVAKKPK